MYACEPCTLEELEQDIRVKVAKIDKAMLQTVNANFQEHLQKWISNNGPHIGDVVFHAWFCQMQFQYELKYVNKFQEKINDFVIFCPTLYKQFH